MLTPSVVSIVVGAAATAVLVACGSGDTPEMPAYTPGTGTVASSRSGSSSSSGGAGAQAVDASTSDTDGGTPTFAPELNASFTLIDTTVTTDPAGSPVPGFDPIPYGSTIDLAVVGHSLSIRANPPFVTQVGSMLFALDVAYAYETNLSPYSLCGDDGMGNFVACSFTLQKHVLTDTTYPQENLGGTPYPPTLFEFVIIDSDADGGTDGGADAADAADAAGE